MEFLPDNQAVNDRPAKKGKKELEEIRDLAKERFRTAREADQAEREAAFNDLCFAVNNDDCQWPSDVKDQRDNDGRPCLVLNKVPEKIDQVEGEFQQLRPTIKPRAVDAQADPKVAEVMGGLIRHIEYNSDARRAYNTAHSSVLHCGRGAWRVDIIRAEDDPFERDLKINRISNVFSVYWDPEAEQLDKSDARFVFVSSMMGEKEFKAQYPDASVDNWDEADQYDTNWRDGEQVRVAEYFYKENRKVQYFQVVRYDGFAGFETVTVRGEDNISPDDIVKNQVEVKEPVIKWCKMTQSEILDGPHEYPGKYLPIVIELGKEVNIEGQQKARGMVRFAKDPQRIYNYWSSATTEQVALSPKAPYIVTDKMLGPYQKVWDNAANNNYFYLPIASDPNYAGQFPKREAPPQMSSAMAAELQRMDHDLMSAMGIYAASLGDQSNEKTGRAIHARQRQGSIGSYTFTDHFEAALIYSAKILIDLIPKIYSSERIVRIMGEDGTEREVPINARREVVQQAQVPENYLAPPKEGTTDYFNDLSVGKYDVYVSIGPSYTTQRQEAAEMLVELATQVPQLGQVAIDLIVKNLDMPGSDELLKRARKIVLTSGLVEPEPNEQVPQPPPDPDTQAKMKELQIKMQELQLKSRKEDREDFSAQVEAIKDIAEAQATKTDAAINELKGTVEAIRAATSDKNEENIG